MQAATGWE